MRYETGRNQGDWAPSVDMPLQGGCRPEEKPFVKGTDHPNDKSERRYRSNQYGTFCVGLRAQ